jgi:hypothetical protein
MSRPSPAHTIKDSTNTLTNSVIAVININEYQLHQRLHARIVIAIGHATLNLAHQTDPLLPPRLNRVPMKSLT